MLEILQGPTTVSEAVRQFDLPPSEIEAWIDQAKAGMENALKALQEAYGEAMLELRAPKMGRPVIEEGRAMILHIQRGLRDEGFAVPSPRS